MERMAEVILALMTGGMAPGSDLKKAEVSSMTKAEEWTSEALGTTMQVRMTFDEGSAKMCSELSTTETRRSPLE